MKNTILFTIAFLLSITAYAEANFVSYGANNSSEYADAQSTIRGTVIDDETGETLIGVNVLIEGTSIGTVTDIDGNFTIQIEEGEYNLVFSYISFATQKVEHVEAKAGDVALVDIRMLPDDALIEEVVVTAKALSNTETAVLTIQKKSANMINGISAQTFSKTGDSDAASAIKRVTGVTVQGGKYIYVRGLGDRYSKSVLNGLEIPGLDPEKNSVQMDIFPTNVLDNIIVYKTFTPDLFGDFTGGMVDVRTKDFPSKKYIKVSASLGMNTETHFKSDFKTYNGSKMDWLGLGGKSRALPFSKDYEPGTNLQELFDNTNALNKEISAKSEKKFANFNVGLSAGNQIDTKNDLKIGYVVALNYKNNYSFRPDQEQSFLRMITSNTSETNYDILVEEERKGKIGIQNTMWNAMGALSFKKNTNKFSLKYLHTQSGLKTASEFNRNDYEDNGYASLATDLDYIQRMISNFIVDGSHHISDKSKLSWGNAFTFASIDNPDKTRSAFVYENDKLIFNSSSNLDKVYRNLNEINNNAKLDYEFAFNQWSGEKSKFKAGLSHVLKNRNRESYKIIIEGNNPSSSELSNIDDVNQLLFTENITSPTNLEGYEIDNVLADKTNQYTSMLNILGAYVMTELPLHAKFKFIGGLRTEYTLMNYNGTDRLTSNPINEQVLNSFQLLPSANFVYNATEGMNIRAAYSRTLARPTFREKSAAILFDPVQGTTFYGNLDLVETSIHNADLRWEYFFGRGETVSLSGFYKNFKNPIEVQPTRTGGADELNAVNRDAANLYGFEFEFRKNFDFIHTKLANLSLGANFTYVKSKIDLSENEQQKYILTQQDVPTSRTMLGQSPYTINTSLGYSNSEIGTQVSLSYNVKGKTLALVGIGGIPDVYEDPFHNLDFKFSQSFGKTKQAKLSFSAKNLIGDRSELNYEFLSEIIGTYRSYSRGRSFSVGFGYSF